MQLIRIDAEEGSTAPCPAVTRADGRARQVRAEDPVRRAKLARGPRAQ